MKQTILFRISNKSDNPRKPRYTIEYQVLTPNAEGTMYAAGDWKPYFRQAMSGGSIKAATTPFETNVLWKARAAMARAQASAEKFLAMLFPPVVSDPVVPQAAPMPQPFEPVVPL